MFKQPKQPTNLGIRMSQIKINTVSDLKAFFKSKAFKKEYKKIPINRRGRFAIITMINDCELREQFKDVIDSVLAQPELVNEYLKIIDHDWKSEIEKLLVHKNFKYDMITRLPDRVYGTGIVGISVDIVQNKDGSYGLPYYDRGMRHIGTLPIDFRLYIDIPEGELLRRHSILAAVNHADLPENAFLNVNVGMDDYYVQPMTHGEEVLDEDEAMEENFVTLITESLSASWMDKLGRDESELRTGLTEWARKHLTNIVEIIDSESETTKLQVDPTTVIEHTWKYIPNPEFGKADDEDEYLFQVGSEARSFKTPLTITIADEEIVLPVLGDVS